VISYILAVYVGVGAAVGLTRTAMLTVGVDRFHRLDDVGPWRWRLFWALMYGVLAMVGWPVFVGYAAYDSRWHTRSGGAR